MFSNDNKFKCRWVPGIDEYIHESGANFMDAFAVEIPKHLPFTFLGDESKISFNNPVVDMYPILGKELIVSPYYFSESN